MTENYRSHHTPDREVLCRTWRRGAARIPRDRSRVVDFGISRGLSEPAEFVLAEFEPRSVLGGLLMS